MMSERTAKVIVLRERESLAVQREALAEQRRAVEGAQLRLGAATVLQAWSHTSGRSRGGPAASSDATPEFVDAWSAHIAERWRRFNATRKPSNTDATWEQVARAARGVLSETVGCWYEEREASTSVDMRWAAELLGGSSDVMVGLVLEVRAEEPGGTRYVSVAELSGTIGADGLLDCEPVELTAAGASWFGERLGVDAAQLAGSRAEPDAASIEVAL